MKFENNKKKRVSIILLFLIIHIETCTAFIAASTVPNAPLAAHY